MRTLWKSTGLGAFVGRSLEGWTLEVAPSEDPIEVDLVSRSEQVGHCRSCRLAQLAHQSRNCRLAQLLLLF
jgi:hypothetical protein